MLGYPGGASDVGWIPARLDERHRLVTREQGRLVVRAPGLDRFLRDELG